MTLENETWIDLTSDRHLTSLEFENDIEVELYIEDIEVSLNDAEDEARFIKESQSALDNDQSIDIDKKVKPQIFLLSSGELSPEFSSRIRSPGVDFYIDVLGTLNGQFKLVDSNE